jgi:type II secretory pathway predicted ATPase ExeA/septal ring-binding cell division protein DamX
MNDGNRRRLDALGLERDPFPLSEVLVDIFPQGGRERFLASLSDTEGLGRPLIAVLGETGVGKTVFFDALLRRLPERVRVARLTSGAYLSAPGVLGAVARALDLPTEEGLDHESLRTRVHAHIAGLLDRGITCVVLVDDADDLEPAALEELVRIAELRPEAERIRVLLFATPALRAALAQAAGARRAEALTHELVLEPFSLNELRAYLRWRLERAGLKGSPPFDEADYQRIHRRSGGVPGRADVLAAQLLFRRPWWQRPAPVVLFCGLVGVVLGVALLLLLPAGREEAPERRTLALPERVSEPDPRGRVERVEPPAVAARDGEGAVADRDGAGRPALSLPVIGGEEEGEVAVVEAPSLPAAARPTAARESAAPDSGPDEPGAGSASSTAAVPAAAEPPVVKPGRAAPVEEVAADGASGGEPEAPVDEGTDADSVAESGRIAVAEEASAAAAPPAGVDDAGAVEVRPAVEEGALPPLRARPEDRYVLQLHVLSEEARARAWIARRDEPGRYRYYARRRGDVLQYVVVAGDYADLEAALAAADEVAAATGAQAPWARSVGALLQEMVPEPRSEEPPAAELRAGPSPP